MFATLGGGLELVKLLISRKANVNHQNKVRARARVTCSPVSAIERGEQSK